MHFLKMYSTFLPFRHIITLLCNCWWLKQPHLIIDGLALIILYIYLNIHTGQASEVYLSGYVTTKLYLLHTDNLIHLDHLCNQPDTFLQMFYYYTSLNIVKPSFDLLMFASS